MIIDFHNHFYPAAYLDAIKAGGLKVHMDYDAQGNPRTENILKVVGGVAGFVAVLVVIRRVTR